MNNTLREKTDMFCFEKNAKNNLSFSLIFMQICQCEKSGNFDNSGQGKPGKSVIFPGGSVYTLFVLIRKCPN